MFKKMFNKLMMPSKISALPTRMFGEDLCKQFEGVEVKWDDADYDVLIYANKSEGNQYDLFLEISTESLDQREYFLQRDLSLHAALKEVKKHDTKRTKELNSKHVPIKRGFNNVEKVRERLFKHGVLKH